jgi:hypothetical protein
LPREDQRIGKLAADEATNRSPYLLVVEADIVIDLVGNLMHTL